MHLQKKRNFFKEYIFFLRLSIFCENILLWEIMGDPFCIRSVVLATYNTCDRQLTCLGHTVENCMVTLFDNEKKRNINSSILSQCMMPYRCVARQVRCHHQNDPLDTVLSSVCPKCFRRINTWTNLSIYITQHALPDTIHANAHLVQHNADQAA
jgi:hypothetical protein